MKSLMMSYPHAIGFMLTFIISITTAIALFILLIKAQKGKFYPAMPFISAGSVAGYLIIIALISII